MGLCMHDNEGITANFLKQQVELLKQIEELEDLLEKAEYERDHWRREHHRDLFAMGIGVVLAMITCFFMVGKMFLEKSGE